MDDQKLFHLAEAICRREYEKRFGCDIGSDKSKVIYFRNIEERMNHMKDIGDFWNELGCKYDKQFNINVPIEKYSEVHSENWRKMKPLHRALSTFCSWMENMTRLESLQSYDKYRKCNQ